MSKPRSQKKLPASFPYRFGQIKAWLYFLFSATMGVFSLLLAIYGQGSIQFWGIGFLLFFTILATLAALLIAHNLIHKPRLQISKKEISCPKTFSRQPIVIPCDRIEQVKQQRIPAVVEIFYEIGSQQTTRLLIWKDMFRNKAEFEEAATLLVSITPEK